MNAEWKDELRQQARNAGVLLALLVGAVAVFTLLSSAWFLYRMEWLREPGMPLLLKATAWWQYVMQPRWSEVLPLAEAFFVGLVLPGVYAKYHWNRLGGLMGIGRRAFGIDKLRRGSTLNHGDADWATLEEMAKVFPPVPSSELGAVAIGELDRVWENGVGQIDFDPKRPETWGNGGRAPLMLYDLTTGSGHGAFLMGSGVGKTTVLTAANLTYFGPRIVVDPDGEIGPQVRATLEAKGLKVVEIRLRTQAEMDALRARGIEDPSPITAGFNVFKSIDRNSPLAQTKLRTVVGRLTKPTSSSAADDKNAIFRQWGKSIIAALLADMIWDPDIPEHEKTPATLRATLCMADELRGLMRHISLHSHSPMARNIAGTILAQHEETFTSAYGYATEDTVWLETEAYSDMVSGDDFDPRELQNGKLAIFLQLPLDAMKETPMSVKVVVGSLTDAIMSFGGNMAAPIWMPVDEAVLMDADPSIQTIINQGRKYMAAIHLYYQSESQAIRVWGQDGWGEIVESLQFRQYAGITSSTSARSVSERLGTYGVIAHSESTNRGKSGQVFTLPSVSSGGGSSTQEMARNLANPYELYGHRTDERITLTKGRSKPFRHGAAMAFRREEMVRLLDDNKFRTKTVAFVPFVPERAAAE